MSAARSRWRQLKVPSRPQIICRAPALKRGSSLTSSAFMVLWRGGGGGQSRSPVPRLLLYL